MLVAGGFVKGLSYLSPRVRFACGLQKAGSTMVDRKRKKEQKDEMRKLRDLARARARSLPRYRDFRDAGFTDFPGLTRSDSNGLFLFLVLHGDLADGSSAACTELPRVRARERKACARSPPRETPSTYRDCETLSNAEVPLDRRRTTPEDRIQGRRRSELLICKFSKNR